MNPIRHIRHIAAALAGLFGAMLTFAMAAPAAFATMPPGGGAAGTPVPPVSYPCSPECSPLLDKHLILSHGHAAGMAYPVHTVVIGGTPGWQIALIAAGVVHDDLLRSGVSGAVLSLSELAVRQEGRASVVGTDALLMAY